MRPRDRLDRLERELLSTQAELANARAEIDHLAAKDAIRNCIARYSRGLDRIDETLLRSAFHPDAVIDFSPAFKGPLEDWIPLAITHQLAQFQAQHMVGQSLIQVDGDSAVAESYGLARHKNHVDGQWIDHLIALRLLDRFSKRNGAWKISERKQVTDWARAVPVASGNDWIYENGLLEKGARDSSDASYRILPSDWMV